MKKIAVLLAALMLVCTLASCAVISGPEQTHEVFELSITMQGNFVRQSGGAYGANVIMSTPSVCVAFYRLEADTVHNYSAEKDLSPALFANFYMDKYMLKEYEIQREDDLVYIETNIDVDGTEYTYFYTFYCGENTYWVVEMSCAADKYEEARPEFVKWANSVTLDQ